MRVRCTENMYIVNEDPGLDCIYVSESDLKLTFPLRFRFGEKFRAKKLAEVKGYYILCSEYGGIESLVPELQFKKYFSEIPEK